MTRITILITVLALTGCAALSPGQSIDDAREQLERVRASADAASVLLDVAETRCESMSPVPAESPCRMLPDARVQLERVRAALRDAEAGLGTLEDAANALAPLIEAAKAVLGEGAR